jgi:hypothetical protein
MRNKDCSNTFALQSGRKRITMAIQPGAWVNDHDIATSDDVRPGTSIGELRRVLGNNATNIWSDLNGLSVHNVIEWKKSR